MKIQLTRDLLLDKLSLASRFTSSKFSSLTHLQGILLEGGDGEINIYSTNLSSFFHTSIKTKEKINFKTIIEPKKLIEVLNLLQPGKVELEITDKQVTISQNKTKSTLPLTANEDFPLPPKIKEKNQVLKTEFLIKELPLVLFAASTDETRPVLTGINFLIQDEELLVVATDGFRLSLLKTNKKEHIPPMTVPREFLYEILRLIKDEKEVSFTHSKEEKMIVFQVGDSEFFSRLIEGDFPAWEKVLPSEKKTTVMVDREEFLRNIKLTSVVARDFSNIVVCDFKKDGLYIRPKTDNNESNEAFQEVELKGEEQKTAFNSRFLIEMLNQLNSKKIVIEILRPDAPIVFKTEDKKNFLHIIMPIRIQQ